MVVGGAPTTNAGRLVASDESVSCMPPPDRFVGRGGHKLQAALEQFDVDPTGSRVIDAGSSTGGFTDCALQAGAAEVVAIDVGRGQLHQRLRDDPRVDVRERLDVRSATPELVGGRADLVVSDLSFISLTSVMRALIGLSREDGDLILLIKPQFEASHDKVSEGGGVIRDPAEWRHALERVLTASEGHGAAIMGLMTSPLRGADGNVEFLVHLRNHGPGHQARSSSMASIVDEVLRSIEEES